MTGAFLIYLVTFLQGALLTLSVLNLIFGTTIDTRIRRLEVRLS